MTYNYNDFKDVTLNSCVCLYDLSDIEMRTLQEASHIIDNNQTIRVTAKNLGISKSTVYYDLSTRLPQISIELYDQIHTIFRKHRRRAN